MKEGENGRREGGEDIGYDNVGSSGGGWGEGETGGVVIDCEGQGPVVYLRDTYDHQVKNNRYRKKMGDSW